MVTAIRQVFNFLEKGAFEYKYSGSNDLLINGFCALTDLKQDCITWIRNSNSYDFTRLDKDINLLIVTNFFYGERVLLEGYNIIECADPRMIFFEILNHFFTLSVISKIESDSIVETQQIGKNVSIGHHCYICKDVVIGNNVVIKHNVVMDCPVQIGDNTIVYSGVVIGTDGFGYYKKDGINCKIPHFGGVKIGKNVEIGANTCIDRGTLSDTIIGDNIKIDNLCQIAHNVHIEDNVIITGMSAVSGSCFLKENVYIAPGSIIIDNQTVGKNSQVGRGSVVIRRVPDNKAVFGVPAKTFRNIDEKI
jgi:UDP-3-O-[3-hydroxymyristoyl] glucosamine N-acyltransferase